MTTQLDLNGLEKFAINFWPSVRGKKTFAFHGNLGAGKTTTIAALCRAIGVTDVIGSPTFSIINEYAFVENGEQKQLFHIDLYRLKSVEEVIAAGVEDCLYSDAICMVEWPEKAPELFDKHTTHVVIEPINEHVRQIKILSAAEFNVHRLTEQL